MTTDQVLDQAANLLTPWAAETTRPEPNRLDAVITRENLLNAVKALREARWGYMTTITGLDLGVEAGQLEALYHFCHNAAVITLRVRIPRDDAQVPSLCGLIPSATLPEREFSELLGVTVVDTPDPAHLFLPDDWPNDAYPLRKDFVLPAEM